MVTGTVSPGSPRPSKFTTLLWLRAPPTGRGGGGRGPPPATPPPPAPHPSGPPPAGGVGAGGPRAERVRRSGHEPRGALATRRLHHLDEPLHPLDRDLVLDELAREVRGLGVAARRVDEREGAVEADLLGDLERLCEVRLGLPREADDDVGRDRAVRNVLADQRDAVHEALAPVGPAHALEDLRAAGLQREVDVLRDVRELGMRADHVLGHVRGMRARVADALDPSDRRDGVEELREAARPRTQAGPVAVDVLAEQRHLLDAVLRELLDLGDELLERAADLAAPGRGDDAEGALHVAAGGDLDPGLEITLAFGREVAGEALELEEALGREALAREELRELVDLTGAEGDVDERELREDGVFLRLRPAAAYADGCLGALAFLRFRFVEVGHEPLVGLLSDAAGVEEDQVGFLACRGLGVAELLEHALHALRVVLVHLAAEGRDVEALQRQHRGEGGYRRGGGGAGGGGEGGIGAPNKTTG